MNHPIAAQKRAEFLGTIDAIAKAFQTSPIGNISELDRYNAAVLLRALGSLLSSPHQDDLVLNIHNLAEGAR